MGEEGAKNGFLHSILTWRAAADWGFPRPCASFSATIGFALLPEAQVEKAGKAEEERRTEAVWTLRLCLAFPVYKWAS